MSHVEEGTTKRLLPGIRKGTTETDRAKGSMYPAPMSLYSGAPHWPRATGQHSRGWEEGQAKRTQTQPPTLQHEEKKRGQTEKENMNPTTVKTRQARHFNFPSLVP